MVVTMNMKHTFMVAICSWVFLNASLAMAASFTQETRFVFAEATSQTLLKSGQIDFATAITLNQNIEAIQQSFDTAIAPPATGEPRYAIIMDVFEAQASRRVLSLKTVPSTVFLGFQSAPLSVTIDDPARSAQGFDNLSTNTAPQNLYGTTAQAVGRPIVLNYAYKKAEIQARRRMSARVYLVDRVRRTYIKTIVDAAEEKRFKVAYRVSYHDPHRKGIKANFDTEAELDRYERLEMLIDLSSLLTDFKNKAHEAKSFTNALALRRVIRAEQTQTLAKLEANKFDARPLNDPRFDSVVAIYTGPGTLGSGFYVTPNVVMTNWHVADGQRFVEMKAYDGLETFGTVLGYDARLDIALIKVERRGRPVKFYTGRTLNPGTEVEAIGHPYGHEFSITRGVVSAIRKHPSINLPRHAGGKDVLFIQTDTPINPGNSGGPLFVGHRVVGMNTWGRTNADGLNFSIHYSELLNFINEHLPGFYVDPSKGS